jgi:hypothetical protein
MNAIHHYEILHNDLSKNNMLHFPTNKSNVVYIGLCDWGETRRMQKVTLCLYMFAKEQQEESVLMGGSIIIFYSWKIMNKNSLHWMTKQHQTTLRFKAYLVGKLTM